MWGIFQIFWDFQGTCLQLKIEIERVGLWVHVFFFFFRHWNGAQSCQHFQGKVEYGRGSTRGAPGVQGERAPRAPDRGCD